MNMKTLPTTELRSLLAAVSDHGKQHLVEVEADLLQTTFLLSEAIEKLGASFMAVHEAVTEQQQVLNALLEAHKFDVAETKKLEEFKQKIGQEVNAAVTGLQFQDLTSQLLNRTIRRVNGLKDLLHELGNHSNDIDPDHEHEEIAKFLDEMSHSLHEGSRTLSGGLRRSVDQQNMTTGDIDLF
ncbi:MAG: chemotaxis protein [Methylotenera sp.]|uniref:chemotaxis protein n=1 Tax=Methylotenera sp. TaxID=2051956 RepID=UPI0025D36408|nr:chemotaxis protein [Methylotenera sp.]